MRVQTTSQPAFVPAVHFEGAENPEAYVFAFRGRKLLVHESNYAARVPRLEELKISADLSDTMQPLRRLFLGYLHGCHQVFAVEFAEFGECVPDGMAFRGLRSLYTLLDETNFNIAGRAIQIIDWDRDHPFCSRCRHTTDSATTERSKRCPNCGLVTYPRLSPAVIVLVERDSELLLARSPHFPPGMYSALAGFVEPGETLEETVIREVEEEVGVLVEEITYFGSQPWPFPNSLMLGFHAQYLSGDIKPDEGEIEEAGWFTVNDLPKIPPKISIARALIDSFTERHNAE